jgi:hypothetical protein
LLKKVPLMIPVIPMKKVSRPDKNIRVPAMP